MARLGRNRYGKAEVRLMKVDRTTDRHVLHDLAVDVALAGDMEAVHLSGDNSAVLPTDTQKNTVFAFAREHGVGEVEEFASRLARHFVDSQPSIQHARVSVREQPWGRLEDRAHSFAQSGGEVRTATVTYDGAAERLLSGLTGLVLLSTTGSEFRGFAKDRYTTLAAADGRLVYFHQNSVVDGGFATLQVGEEVRFVAQDRESDKGPQASTVPSTTGFFSSAAPSGTQSPCARSHSCRSSIARSRKGALRLSPLSVRPRTPSALRSPVAPSNRTRAVHRARAAGLGNLSVDLIFALPPELRRDMRAAEKANS